LALYGKEPKKLLSLDFVCKCQVLIQIIGKTITAMLLAAFPNWAEIFFYSTTHQQGHFLTVISSLMGDGLESIDPIIVSYVLF
jgi:hypothetical protein